jgi:hypothetical protein
MAKRIEVGPRLHVGMFSKQVLLAKRVQAEPLGDGTAFFHVFGEQVDVTEQFEEVAKELGYVRVAPEQADALRESLDVAAGYADANGADAVKAHLLELRSMLPVVANDRM